jgi:CRP-like cAMP-binding protein
MREDETLQAILRFGRDEEGAVVFAHTSALAECLPVVAEGQVGKTFTENGRAITEVARQYRDDPFAISDLVDEVDCSRETVRRTLNELAALGYLTSALCSSIAVIGI